MIVMNLCGFTNFIKCTTLVGDADSGEEAWGEGGGIWEHSVLPT